MARLVKITRVARDKRENDRIIIDLSVSQARQLSWGLRREEPGYYRVSGDVRAQLDELLKR
jgi:hypothetical protein